MSFLGLVIHYSRQFCKNTIDDRRIPAMYDFDDGIGETDHEAVETETA
jgi:hypothetical protein